MNSYAASTAVNLVFTPQDELGNPIDLSTVSYEVRDGSGTVLVPLTPIAGYVQGTDIEISLDASVNALASGKQKDIRSILFTGLDQQQNVASFERHYFVLAGDGIQVGKNSFMSLALAELVASDIPSLTGWVAATREQKIAALIDARLRIVRLRFNLGNSAFAQDNISFIPEGTLVVNYANANDPYSFRGDLSLLSPEQFAGLPEKFRMALYRAQIAEADNILGLGNDISIRREEGLLAETIGETRQQFRPGKPLQLPICRRAMAYLSTYIIMNMRLGRS